MNTTYVLYFLVNCTCMSTLKYQCVAWGLSPSLVGLAQTTSVRTRVPRVSVLRSSVVIAYLVCVTFGGSGGDLFCHGRYCKSLGREIGET